MDKTFISFVVDNLSSLYYQAELLLYSLEKFSKIPKKNIVVQCTKEVDTNFVKFLKDNHYAYNFIEPFLDKKYCNKLQQLDYFENKDIDAVMLLDTDIFITNKLEFSKHIFQAKIVDGPNPSLETLLNIYNAANMVCPDIIETDCNHNAKTLSNNFNGGFYYIPKKDIYTINKGWKKWATWLFDNPDIFLRSYEKTHIDQIAMGLVLQENNIPYVSLSANYNYPLHKINKPASLDETMPVCALHYHQEIDDFGYFKKNKQSNDMVLKAIDIANNSISNKKNFKFYQQYLKSKKFYPVFDINDVDLLSFREKMLKLIGANKPKLFLFAGTPKTATTSLQYLFHDNSKELLDNGIFYPNLYFNNPVPKHQWLVSALKSDNFVFIYKSFEKILAEYEKYGNNTILLFTEGIYNHWNDFSKRAKQALFIIATFFDIKLNIVLREPISFIDSLYKQNLKNPTIEEITCYDKDISFYDMYQNDWFSNQLNYLGFIMECENIFGKDNINVIKYSKNIIKDITNLLGLNMKINSYYKNGSFSDATIEMLRIVNRYNLKRGDKYKVLEMLNEIDNTINKYSKKINYAKEYENEILNRLSLQLEVLKTKYNIVFER